MKPTLTRSLVSALVLALATGLGAAYASPDGQHCGPGGWNPEKRMQHGMKEVSRLHDDLKLDAKQEALWQEAKKNMRGQMGEMREQMRKQRETALASLDQPGSDLRAAIRQMDEAREAGRKQHEANRERWLSLYDSLNPEQKEKARQFIRNKLTRMEHMGRGPRS